MGNKKIQYFTLDDLGMITFPIPQIDGRDDFEADAAKLSRSDEKNKCLREMIRKEKVVEEELKQM